MDDEFYSVENLKKKLDWVGLGFQDVFCAYSKNQAQEVFAKANIDLMICDIEMPRGSGLELLEWVRQQGFSTICIFLTCWAKFEYASSALSLGCVEYLLKPVKDKELLEAVKKGIIQVGREQMINKAGEAVSEDQNGDGNNSSGEKNTGAKVQSWENPRRSVVEQACQYIREHLEEEMGRDEIAAAVFVSPDHLSHIFSEKMGCSLSAYILSMRISRAKELLLLGKESIRDVAISCGFQNISYFSKCFKKIVGKTPQEYQKEMRLRKKQ